MKVSFYDLFGNEATGNCDRTRQRGKIVCGFNAS